jgi:hypothetical protein
VAVLPAGSNVYGADFPPSQFDQDWTTILNITTTTYVAGTPEVAVSMTAPSSGKVLVCMGCGIRNNAATTERAIVTYQIFEDSLNGAIFSAPLDDRGVKSCGIAVSQEYQYHGNMDLITGLTPGRSYYFQMVHLSLAGAGTVDIASRNIMVIPVP